MVTKQQQLEFAAKHIEKWKSGYDYAVVEETTDGHLCVRWPSICTSGVTKKEWQQERDKMQKQSAQDNSWHESGGLPPVGCVCLYVISDRCSYEVEITAHAKLGICFVEVGKSGENYVSKTAEHRRFQPLRTERGKAIDEMVAVISSMSILSVESIAEKLYDSGYRKVNP